MAYTFQASHDISSRKAKLCRSVGSGVIAGSWCWGEVTCVSTRQLCVRTLTDKRGNSTSCASACAGNVDSWLHAPAGRRAGNRRKEWMAISVSGVKFPLTSCGLRNGQGSVKQFLFSLFCLNSAYHARLLFAKMYVTPHLPLASANSCTVGRVGCLFKGACLGEISRLPVAKSPLYFPLNLREICFT